MHGGRLRIGSQRQPSRGGSTGSGFPTLNEQHLNVGLYRASDCKRFMERWRALTDTQRTAGGSRPAARSWRLKDCYTDCNWDVETGHHVDVQSHH